MNQHSSLLQGALRGNAVFSLVSGITAVVAAGSVAGMLGEIDPRLLRGLGVGLIGFAALVFWVSLDTRRMASLTGTIVVADLLWVVATVGLVVAGVFHSTGVALVAGIALIVGGFAVLQWYGLQQMRRSTVS